MISFTLGSGKLPMAACFGGKCPGLVRRQRTPEGHIVWIEGKGGFKRGIGIVVLEMDDLAEENENLENRRELRAGRAGKFPGL